MLRKLIIIIVLGVIALGGVLWALTYFWQGLGSGLSGHGWFAYLLGGVLTISLSVGLFLLTFLSSRHGYDDIDPTDENST